MRRGSYLQLDPGADYRTKNVFRTEPIVLPDGADPDDFDPWDPPDRLDADPPIDEEAEAMLLDAIDFGDWDDRHSGPRGDLGLVLADSPDADEDGD